MSAGRKDRATITRFLCSFLAVWVLLGSVATRAADWSLLKGKHFLVYYGSDADHAERVLRSAEKHYRQIADELAFTKYSNFWLWDNRSTIMIYDSRRDFLEATGAPQWASGKADYREKEIVTFRSSPDFLNSVLPHELAHLVFREFVGFDNGIPLWLDEGVAQWAERKKRVRGVRLAGILLRRGRLMALKDLTRLDIRKVQDSGRAAEFYTQALSVVTFLVDKHGARNFRAFCGHLRDGKSLDDALRFTYPDVIRNIEELEEGWIHYLLEEAQ